MHYFLYPTKDTYLTSEPDYINKNMGLDEILQVDKVMSEYGCASVSGSLSAILSRALLQFDFTQISQSIAAGTITSASFFLNLKVCQSDQVAVAYDLAAYPVSQPWVMGTGYRYDGAITADGATWKFKDVSATKWVSGSLTDCTGGATWYSTGTTQASGSPVPVVGGYACSQSFDYQSSDVCMDVTNIVNAWIRQAVPNYGLVLMHADQSSSISYGSLKFFSKETNTVYSPYIDVCWNDVVFNTGSADPIDITDAVVNIKNMMPEYKWGSIVRFNVTARQRYPVKTFTNRLSDYLAPYYLPYNSFYCIKDAESEMEIIPYDDYTRLSMDSKGNYFKLDTTGLPQERYFKVEIRAEESGSILTYTVPTTFKISR